MYLGLDLGTSGLKALVCDEKQRVLGRARVGYRPDTPGAGRSEQDPDVWIRAVREAVAALHAEVPGLAGSLRLIGLSGQMHGLVALGEGDRPLFPAILWNDGRGADWPAAAPEETATITGVGPMASFTAAKLHWLRGEDPDAVAAIRRIVLPKDYLRLWLTGDWASEPSDAAGTQLFDEGAGAWSEVMAAAVGLDIAALPPLVGSAEIAGRLRPEVASELGLPPVPVVAGAADTPAGALAVGCTGPGDALISLGTGALAIAGSDAYAPSPDPTVHHFAHALPGRFYRMGAILNCGSALDWAARLTGLETGAAMAELDSAPWDGPSPVLALAGLSGTRTPLGDPMAKGALLGLGLETGPLDVVRAMAEGITCALSEAISALEAGGAIGTPVVIGGGTRSAWWMGLLATVLDRPLRIGASEGSALGAVRLAMLGDGLPPETVLTGPETREVTPDRARREAAVALLARYRAAQAATRL